MQAPTARRQRAVATAASLADDIKQKVEYVAGGDPEKFSEKELYEGTAHSVRQELVKQFNRTHKYFE